MESTRNPKQPHRRKRNPRLSAKPKYLSSLQKAISKQPPSPRPQTAVCRLKHMIKTEKGQEMAERRHHIMMVFEMAWKGETVLDFEFE
jgi:hypothetical protein